MALSENPVMLAYNRMELKRFADSHTAETKKKRRNKTILHCRHTVITTPRLKDLLLYIPHSLFLSYPSNPLLALFRSDTYKELLLKPVTYQQRQQWHQEAPTNG